MRTSIGDHRDGWIGSDGSVGDREEEMCLLTPVQRGNNESTECC